MKQVINCEDAFTVKILPHFAREQLTAYSAYCIRTSTLIVMGKILSDAGFYGIAAHKKQTQVKNDKFRLKMKIAFILPSFPCISETFILTQIVKFIKMGHDVTIYAMSKPVNSIFHRDYMKFRLDLKTKYAYSIPCSKFRVKNKGGMGNPDSLVQGAQIIQCGYNTHALFKQQAI